MTRRMDPKSKMVIMLMKLLNKRGEPSMFGSIEYVTKAGKIYLQPNWITEST